MLLLVKILTPLLITNPDTIKQTRIDHCRDVISVVKENNSAKDYIHDRQIYTLGCDTLAQIKFWQKIMKLSQDSCLVSIAPNRTIIATLDYAKWDIQSDDKKTVFRDSIRQYYCLPDSTRIIVTEGKSFFYNFDKAFQHIHQGIQGFVANGVDPWYAQAILLIESPNKLQKSNVGAYGAFQLMKPVARMFGLKVNKQIDERADFDRSAYASSSLIKKICIPKTKEMLDAMGIRYKEQDTWFRLLVMHCYHAGAGNVRAALLATKHTEGNMELIKKLWVTEARGFKGASQNYSQLALAAMIEMDKLLAKENANLVVSSN